MERRPPLDEWLSLFQSTIAAEGITTGPGAAAGTSIVDAGLSGAGANSFVSMLMVLYPGQPLLVDSQDITAFNTVTGEVTFAGAYKGIVAAIPAGVPYKIVTFRFVPAEVAALTALVVALMADVGDASTSVLGSIWNILGNPAVDLATQIAAIIVAINSGLQEQADVPFNVNAALGEANIFDLSAANTRYVVRSLRLKCVDPGVETVTVRLYELINNVQTLIDTFDITTANFATAHSLMDMFGLPYLVGDNLKVAVIATAVGPYACTGQYCTATAGV